MTVAIQRSTLGVLCTEEVGRFLEMATVPSTKLFLLSMASDTRTTKTHAAMLPFFALRFSIIVLGPYVCLSCSRRLVVETCGSIVFFCVLAKYSLV